MLKKVLWKYDKRKQNCLPDENIQHSCHKRYKYEDKMYLEEHVNQQTRLTKKDKGKQIERIHYAGKKCERTKEIILRNQLELYTKN